MANESDLRRVKRLLREAEGYLELSMSSHALEVLDQIEDAGPSSFHFHYLRGMTLRDLSEHARALESFEVSLREEPDNINLLLAMAWCSKRVGDVARSIRLLEAAYKVAPQEAIILYNIA